MSKKEYTMTRLELETWCEKFLNNVFENGKAIMSLTVQAVEEDWEQVELMKRIRDIDPKTYTDYKKEMADFIEQYAERMEQ